MPRETPDNRDNNFTTHAGVPEMDNPGPPESGVVVVDFGKGVTWLAISPQDAIALAQSLIKHARAISKEPLTVQLF